MFFFTSHNVFIALQEHLITGTLQLQPSGHSLPGVYLPYVAGECISAKTI